MSAAMTQCVRAGTHSVLGSLTLINRSTDGRVSGIATLEAQ